MIASAGAGDGVVLLSGGIDSASAAAWALERGTRPRALGFVNEESQHAQRRAIIGLADRLGLRLHLLHVDNSSRFAAELLTAGGRGEDAAWDMALLRDMTTWIAGAAAISSADPLRVTLGVNLDNRRDYAPLTLDLLDRIGDFIGAFAGRAIEVQVPFWDWHKSDVLRYASERGIDLADTWSCERDGRLHCGACRHCRDRLAAFQTAGMKDPADYLASGG